MAVPVNWHKLSVEKQKVELQRIMQRPAVKRKLERGFLQQKEKKLLSQKEKEAIAAKGYVEKEEAEVEQQRVALDADWKARMEFSAEHADVLVGDTYQCSKRKSDEAKAAILLKRDLALADHQYNFVRMDGESDDEVEKREESEHNSIKSGFNIANKLHSPEVVDPGILSKLRGKCCG